ncbi:MAG TPA: universal stress protein [Gaiellaceae bacterium]|jgi:nucleotide-binding universal stress UspA family protein
MFGTIVLAVDGSRPSDKAVDYAGRLAKESGSRIVAVHVKEIMAGRAAGPVHVDEDEILAKVRGQIKQLNDDGVKAELQVTSTMTGGPAHVIAEAAAKESADVIVTGTRGHTALAGVFLGSVAQRLLHLAGCPVLVVPDAAAAGTGAAASHEAAAVS